MKNGILSGIRRRRTGMPRLSLLTLLLLITCAQPAGSQGFAVLHDFAGPEGAHPRPGLVVSGTNLFGTAAGGGSGMGGSGTVFRVHTDGDGFSVLHKFSFSEGINPQGGLVLSGTTLYGTTEGQYSGWFGSVFRMNTDGSGFRVLKTFAGGVDGQGPSSLVLSGDFLYGTTFSGGISNVGTVFKIGVDGSNSVILKHFAGDDGATVAGGLVVSGSSLYGATVNGGKYGNGTLFRMHTDGSGFALIKSYGAPGTLDQGTNPVGDLALSGETLYGCTINGSKDRSGTVFKVRTDGSGYVVLHEFSGGDDGWAPSSSLVLDADTLYGTTYYGGVENGQCQYGCGTLFKVRTDGTGFATLKRFSGLVDGGRLLMGRLAIADGALYGATDSGGSQNLGVLFTLSRPRRPISLSVTRNDVGGILSVWRGSPAVAYEVLTSTELSVWKPFAVVTSDANGVFSVSDDLGAKPSRFFRPTVP